MSLDYAAGRANAESGIQMKAEALGLLYDVAKALKRGKLMKAAFLFRLSSLNIYFKGTRYRMFGAK